MENETRRRPLRGDPLGSGEPSRLTRSLTRHNGLPAGAVEVRCLHIGNTSKVNASTRISCRGTSHLRTLFVHGFWRGTKLNGVFYTRWYLTQNPGNLRSILSSLALFDLWSAQRSRSRIRCLTRTGTWRRTRMLQRRARTRWLIISGWVQMRVADPNPLFDTDWYLTHGRRGGGRKPAGAGSHPGVPPRDAIRTRCSTPTGI